MRKVVHNVPFGSFPQSRAAVKVDYSGIRHFRPITRSARAPLLLHLTTCLHFLLCSTDSTCLRSPVPFRHSVFGILHPFILSKAELQIFFIVALLYCYANSCIKPPAVLQDFHNAAQPRQSARTKARPLRARRSSLTLSFASPHLRRDFTTAPPRFSSRHERAVVTN